METKPVSGLIPGNATIDETKRFSKAKNVEGSENAASENRNQKKDFDVKLSNRAKEIATARAKALEIARNTPEVREDKVEEFKRRIQNGEYQVDSGKVADGMLREAIRDRLATMGDE